MENPCTTNIWCFFLWYIWILSCPLEWFSFSPFTHTVIHYPFIQFLEMFMRSKNIKLTKEIWPYYVSARFLLCLYRWNITQANLLKIWMTEKNTYSRQWLYSTENLKPTPNFCCCTFFFMCNRLQAYWNSYPRALPPSHTQDTLRILAWP